MAKVRVHELAKELGITSKEALSTLKDLGEFVSSASSTIEPPVVKKLRNAYPGAGKSAAKPGSTPAAPAAVLLVLTATLAWLRRDQTRSVLGLRR